MLIDTHTHLNFNAFNEDYDEIIKECLVNDTWMINVGTQYKTSKKAADIAQGYKQGVYAAIGLHPIHLNAKLVEIEKDSSEPSFKIKGEDFNYDKYKELAKKEKVVAIGEIGLDYLQKPENEEKLKQFKENQKRIFLEQSKLAEEMKLPIIVHCRKAHDELLEILNSKNKGVIHCFTGNRTQLKKYLEKGFYIGLNGIIFKLNLEKVIKQIPLERILVETDCPYLSPPPFQGKRNKPTYVKYVVEEIARIKDKSIEEISEITAQNAIKLFSL